MTEKAVLQTARQLFEQKPDWVTFFREILGLEGAVRQAFPKSEDLVKFERTSEYREIQAMLSKLRERSTPFTDIEPSRVITIRLPKSLHDVLRAEARERRASISRLCISKLLQVVDNELLPDKGEEQSRPIALYFDLAEFSPNEIAEAVSFISNIYRDVGGDALVIEGMEVLDSVPVSQG